MPVSCPNCGRPVASTDKFCGSCGNPVIQAPPASSDFRQTPADLEYQQMGSPMQGFNDEPIPELSNPKDPIRVGDLLVKIEGELVPVVDVELGQQQSIYFEHHILLWKHPHVRLGMKGLKGAGRRFFAGLQIFISEAHGPGNIAFSREATGQIVALRLQRGQSVDVREHQFLLATSNIDYSFFFQRGLANIFFSRSGGLFIDRFTGTNDGGLLLIHGYGNVFEKHLAPGEVIDVEPGAWVWKDASVQMDTVTALQSGGGGIMGAIGAMVGGFSLVLNRFTGPGRLGLQSMTYHPPTDEGATQEGGTSNVGGVGGVIGQLFNS
ncbi:MAG: AIM24 family protein [Chroococcidiopsidaceae cyanobacterium CP_BM_ER_R8_30]|nr:AIM24 family protein [Chroococcidiopsidaceae cyanobacterium CP_BM_ER_R8_30]